MNTLQIATLNLPLSKEWFYYIAGRGILLTILLLSHFMHFKKEEAYLRHYKSFDDAKSSLLEYIEGFIIEIVFIHQLVI